MSTPDRPEPRRELKVAAAQFAPVYHDLPGATERAAEIIAEAGSNGVQLLVFPETWLCGYPYWASVRISSPEFAACRRAFQRSAVEIPGPEIDVLCGAAKEHGVAVVIGVNESGAGSVYNTQVFIDSRGELKGRHRKLVPTATERLVHGRGDGSDLLAHEMAGARTSGLICFEHQMAPARFLLNNHSVEVHAAIWPGHRFLDPVIDASCRHLAHENACFVIVAREVMDKSRLPPDFPDPGGVAARWEMRGGSSVIGPDGAYVVEPVFEKEMLVSATIDLERIRDAKWLVDGAGHYARPDVFQLHWHRSSRRNIVED